MTENAEKVIEEIRATNKLSQEILDEVGDSIIRIHRLLGMQSE
jgi:hypothetical protein